MYYMKLNGMHLQILLFTRGSVRPNPHYIQAISNLGFSSHFVLIQNADNKYTFEEYLKCVI